jgi:hypothetical protein
MTATVNFASAISAFNAAVTALEGVTAGSPERNARLTKILGRIEADSALVVKVVNFKSSGTKGSVAAKAGDEVEFQFGRGETLKTGLRGVVIGVREKAEGVHAAVKIRVGSGFDEEIFTVSPGNITGIVGAPAIEEEASEEDQLDRLEAEVQG